MVLTGLRSSGGCFITAPDVQATRTSNRCLQPSSCGVPRGNINSETRRHCLGILGRTVRVSGAGNDFNLAVLFW